jgi:tetratricopeptide (TPR) repeat protein
VLLLHWPGADWRVIQPLLDAGQLPHLESLVLRGVSGKLVASLPLITPALSTSLATGCWADGHGVLGWVKPASTAAGVVPLGAPDLCALPLWHQVAASGGQACAVGWPLSFPAGGSAAVIVSDAFAPALGATFEQWPLPASSVWPLSLRADLAELRVHPSEITAEQLLPFCPQAARIDQETDERLPLLITQLARAASVHSAGTWLASGSAGTWDLLAIHFDFIESLSTHFMRYRAPRLPQVTALDFEIYRDVVDGAYRFMDLLLGRYLELMPPDTHVIVASAHGFLLDDLRPTTAAGVSGQLAEQGYRGLGMLVAAGPGLREDALVFGATVRDLAPTVLQLLQRPAAGAMDGQVLQGLFDDGKAPVPLPARTLSATPAQAPAPPQRIDEAGAARRLREWQTLGYLRALDHDPETAADQAQASWLANLAEVKTARGRPREALLPLQQLLQLAPGRVSTRLALAQVCLAVGDAARCRELLKALTDDGVHSADLELLRAQLSLHEHDAAQARCLLQQLGATASAGAIGRKQLELMGRLQLQLGDWLAAESSFSQALQIDSEFAAAWRGLGLALVGRGDHAAAIEPLMRSLGLLYQQPDVHYQLGRALAAVGRLLQAQEALHNALRIEPGLAPAQAALQQVHAALAHEALQAVRATPPTAPPHR